VCAFEKKHYLIALLCGCLMAAWPAKSQTPNASPAAELFIGASTLWETTPLRIRFTNPGFDAAVTYNLNHFVGLETNVSAFVNGTPGAALYVDRFRLLLGPHFAHNANSRVTLFAHALAGFTRGERCTAGCYIYVPPPIPLAGAQQEGNAFTAAVGGGVDVRIFRFFWFRPAQADYVHVFFPRVLDTPLYSSPENNLQLAFGFTFRFGRRKE
jgi:hypothetical protein